MTISRTQRQWRVAPRHPQMANITSTSTDKKKKKRKSRPTHNRFGKPYDNRPHHSHPLREHHRQPNSVPSSGSGPSATQPMQPSMQQHPTPRQTSRKPRRPAEAVQKVLLSNSSTSIRMPISADVSHVSTPLSSNAIPALSQAPYQESEIGFDDNTDLGLGPQDSFFDKPYDVAIPIATVRLLFILLNVS
jgi:hypothetical protein